MEKIKKGEELKIKKLEKFKRKQQACLEIHEKPIVQENKKNLCIICKEEKV